jgi:DHA2 family multidrug resistance protein
MISRFVSDPPYIQNAKPGRMDSIGLGLLAVWLGALQIILDKGQEDDWFGAIWIRWATLILVVTLAAFIIRELKIGNPLVNLRIFSNRNFALGCILIGLFGGVIYGLITLLPLFYQTLMGYTAAAAGLAVAPRGVGAVLIMPVIAILTSRLDNRWLIATGFGVFGFTALAFGHVTLEMSQWSMLWPIIISGMASGMVFVPLSTTAMGTLGNEQIGNASGLYNLMRNIGGSIGISLVNTLVSRHEQMHRSELVGHLAPGTASYDQTLRTIQTQVPGDRAYLMINRTLDQQAAMWSYVDDFRYLALACFLCVPVVLMLKQVRHKKGAVQAAH